MVLGLYSPGLAAAGILVLLVMAASVTALFRPGLFRRLRGSLSGIPEFVPVGLLVFPLPAFLLCWFLFPFPILERWNAVLGLCLLLEAPGVFIAGCRSGRARSDVFKGAAVAAVSLLVSLTAAELAARRLVPGSFFNPRLGLIPYARHSIMLDIPGTSRGGTLSTNRWGLRGEEPPDDWEGTTTIVTVGGSTTANYYLDDSRTWSNVMQEALRKRVPAVWVGNGGIPMHTTESHDYFLREVVARIRPDVVVFLVGVNDMSQFMRGELATGGRPMEEGGLREFLFRNSRLLQALYKAKKVYVDGVPAITVTSEPTFAPVPMSGEELPLPDDLGELLPDPDLYRDRIERLIRTSRELEVTPVFLTQPLLFHDSDYWRGMQGGSYWMGGADSAFSAATYWLMLDHLNRQLMDVCRVEGVACLDLASLIPHDRSMFYDSMHFTEAGAARTGYLIAKFLLANGVPIPTDAQDQPTS